MEPQLIPSAIFLDSCNEGGVFKLQKFDNGINCVCITFHLCDHRIQLVVAWDFECVAACCSVMQCVTVSCRVFRVFQCAIVYGSVW